MAELSHPRQRRPHPATQDIPDSVVEVPAGFAISSEAPARSRRTRLSNYQRTRGKKFNLPVLNSGVGDSVCSDDDRSTICDDENDNCPEEFVDADSISDNGPQSIKTASHTLICMLMLFKSD